MSRNFTDPDGVINDAVSGALREYDGRPKPMIRTTEILPEPEPELPETFEEARPLLIAALAVIRKLEGQIFNLEFQIGHRTPKSNQTKVPSMAIPGASGRGPVSHFTVPGSGKASDVRMVGKSEGGAKSGNMPRGAPTLNGPSR